MCPSALFMETALGAPEHEIWYIDISRPGRTVVHYVTRSSHQMQKHNFYKMCPSTLFIEIVPGPHKHEKYRNDISRPGSTGMHYVT
jgi:hypothetical protein